VSSPRYEIDFAGIGSSRLLSVYNMSRYCGSLRNLGTTVVNPKQMKRGGGGGGRRGRNVQQQSAEIRFNSNAENREHRFQDEEENLSSLYLGNDGECDDAKIYFFS
jgi:hypothetical protein